MWCLTIMIQCLLCVASSEMHHNIENTTATSLVTASVIPNMPVRSILEFLETPMLGDSVRIRPNDYELLLNPSVLYFNDQTRWTPRNINPLHNHTNVYLIHTNNQIVKVFGIEHAYSSPYILMSVLEQEASQLCIQLHDENVEYTTCICSAGYTKSSSDECVACATGTYKEITGNEACTICPGNSSSPTGNPACSCKPGFQGFPACDVCEIGYFTSMFNNTVYCLQCPGGKTSSMNSTSTADCACPPGTEESANVCTPCPLATYEVGGICTPCGVQSNAPQGSTQCSCNQGSIRGTDGICTCDKEYSLASQNTGICQSCPFNSYKPLIGNTPCLPCPINQWSTTETPQCHCRPGFGTHAQPAVVRAISQYCWGLFTWPAAMEGSIQTANNLFTSNRNCIYEVRAPSSATTIQIIRVSQRSMVQQIIQYTQSQSYVSYVGIPAWTSMSDSPTFSTGFVWVVMVVVWDKIVLPYGDHESFSFSWKVLPSFTCNFCDANMYQNSTGLYSQCHACPDQKTSPPASTSPDQCS
jgi:hypothetical protein